MAYSKVVYTGDGTTKLFSIPFPYIVKANVKVYFGAVLQAASTYEFNTVSSITFTVAPPAATVLSIQRDTEKGVRLVDFQDSSVLTEAALDLNTDQLLYVTQESYDEREVTPASLAAAASAAASEVSRLASEVSRVASGVSAAEAAASAFDAADKVSLTAFNAQKITEQNSSTRYLTITGTDNALTGTLTPAITAYVIGQKWHFIAGLTNTGATTGAISGLPARAIVKGGTTALEAADIKAGNAYILIDDGVRLQLSGGTGGGAGLKGGAILINKQTLTSSVEIATGESASMTGPMTLPTGMTITVATGSKFVIH